jgi:hypothetical protein
MQRACASASWYCARIGYRACNVSERSPLSKSRCDTGHAVDSQEATAAPRGTLLRCSRAEEYRPPTSCVAGAMDHRTGLAQGAGRSAYFVNTTGSPPRQSIYAPYHTAIGQPAQTSHLTYTSLWTGSQAWGRPHRLPKPHRCPYHCPPYLAYPVPSSSSLICVIRMSCTALLE